MQSTPIQKHRAGRLRRTLCDVGGVLFGLLFLAVGIWILDGNREPNITFDRSIEGVMQRGLIAATLLFVSICLALSTKLYWDRCLRIAGQLAASMTSAATSALACWSLVGLVSVWTSNPSPGSAADDIRGIVAFIFVIISLAAFLVFLPCTYILARKSRMRLAHLAIGTAMAGAVGGLAVYLCY